MERRTFLLGLLGGLAAAPTIIAATSSVEAAPFPEVLPQPTSAPALSEADLEMVNADWSQGVRRRVRRRARRMGRRTRRMMRRSRY